jgi:iron(III) transport system permease protein
VSVIDMDDSGQTVAAAAMAMMIFYTNVAARTVHAGLGGWRDRRPQAWRCG